MFKELNPLLHSELRLAVVSILIGVESADFVFIRQQTGATAGNLSVQLDKLAKAGYIEVEKTFRGKIPCTVCRITDAGRDAFAEYVEALQSYIKRYIWLYPGVIRRVSRREVFRIIACSGRRTA